MSSLLRMRASRYYAARPMIFAKMVSSDLGDDEYEAFLSEFHRWRDDRWRDYIFEENIRMPMAEIVYEKDGKIRRFYFDAAKWLMDEIRKFGPKTISINLRSTSPTGIAKRRWFLRRIELAKKFQAEYGMTREEALREAGIIRMGEKPIVIPRRRGFSQKAIIFTELIMYSTLVVYGDGEYDPTVGNILINGIEGIKEEIFDVAENYLLLYEGDVKIVERRLVAGQPRRLYAGPWITDLRSILSLLYSWRGIKKRRTELWRELILLALWNVMSTLKKFRDPKYRRMGFLFIRVPSNRLHAFVGVMVRRYRAYIRGYLTEYYKSKEKDDGRWRRFLPFSFLQLL